MTAEERYEQRLVKVKPLLDAFFSWLEEQNISGKGKLAKAVRYIISTEICLRYAHQTDRLLKLVM